MRAAVVVGPGQPLALEERDDPAPGPGQVVLEVGRCGICGSDLHMIDDPRYRRPGEIMGHEIAGRIVAAGADVERLSVGDHVAIIPFRSCGVCAACRAGEPAWCGSMALEGGGYAELALTHERQCVRLPQSVNVVDGALVEPVAVALHAINVSGLMAGQRVLVVGAGPIGLAVVWWARRRGAQEIAVCDLAAERRERALALAATGIEEGFGTAAPVSARYDIVFDCAGAKGVLAGAVDSVRPRGTVVLTGICTSPDSFVPFAAVRKEARILTSVFFSAQEFEDALDAICGEPRLAAALVTSSVSLWDLPAKFERLRRGDCSECKVLIEPRAGPAGSRDI